MNKGPGTLNRSGKLSTAATIRRRIENGGERFWRVKDFVGLSPVTVARTLARLEDAGVIERVRKGLYYRSHDTIVGPSLPSATATIRHSLNAPLHPAGLSAANFLGLTTQNPARAELATPATNPPGVLRNVRVHTRRPASRARLNEHEGAVLELLRARGRYSDLPPDETVRRLHGVLADGNTFDRVARAALDEPPRVRAMLGAIGEDMSADERAVKRLRNSINPLSKFDFGVLRHLPNAERWQAH